MAYFLPRMYSHLKVVRNGRELIDFPPAVTSATYNGMITALLFLFKDKTDPLDITVVLDNFKEKGGVEEYEDYMKEESTEWMVNYKVINKAIARAIYLVGSMFSYTERKMFLVLSSTGKFEVNKLDKNYVMLTFDDEVELTQFLQGFISVMNWFRVDYQPYLQIIFSIPNPSNFYDNIRYYRIS